MSKIKVGELKEVIKLNGNENIKTVQFNGLEIEILTQTTIQEKINLVSSMFESAIDREDGLHILNGNNLDIAFKVLLVKAYATNLTLPKDTIQTYDLLVSSGLYDLIYESIPEREILDLQMALNNHIDAEYETYKQTNTIQYIIKEFINNLPSKEETEELIANMSEQLEGVSPDNLKFLAKAIGWNNGVEN